MEEYFDSIQPQVGEAWRTDKIHLKIKGRKRYLFAMLDSETRYWIVKQVAEHKGKGANSIISVTLTDKDEFMVKLAKMFSEPTRNSGIEDYR